jgi:hypothetical protein
MDFVNLNPISKPVVAVRAEDGETARMVFDLRRGLFAVVKLFPNEKDGRPSTVKLWNLKDSSLEKTMSYWKTNVPFEPSPGQIAEAFRVLNDLITEAASALNPDGWN